MLWLVWLCLVQVHISVLTIRQVSNLFLQVQHMPGIGAVGMSLVIQCCEVGQLSCFAVASLQDWLSATCASSASGRGSSEKRCRGVGRNMRADFTIFLLPRPHMEPFRTFWNTPAMPSAKAGVGRLQW